jgi:hypothetical protein
MGRSSIAVVVVIMVSASWMLIAVEVCICACPVSICAKVVAIIAAVAIVRVVVAASLPNGFALPRVAAAVAGGLTESFVNINAFAMLGQRVMRKLL